MTPTSPRTNRAALAAYLRTAMTAKYGPRYKGTQLARDSGLSDQTVSQILKEKRDPTPDSLRRIAPALDVPYADLLAVAEITTPEGGAPPTVVPPPDPTADLIRALRERARGVPADRLGDLEEDVIDQMRRIETERRRQIGILEEYVILKAELLRRAAENADPNIDNGVDAS